MICNQIIDLYMVEITDKKHTKHIFLFLYLKAFLPLLHSEYNFYYKFNISNEFSNIKQ